MQMSVLYFSADVGKILLYSSRRRRRYHCMQMSVLYFSVDVGIKLLYSSRRGRRHHCMQMSVLHFSVDVGIMLLYSIGRRRKHHCMQMSGLHFNPFTAPACKISGLKCGHVHACKQYIRWSYKKSTINTVHFNTNNFTCSCERGVWGGEPY